MQQLWQWSFAEIYKSSYQHADVNSLLDDRNMYVIHGWLTGFSV